MEHFFDLLMAYGNYIIGAAAGLSVLVTILFTVRYVTSNTERRLGTKLLDIVVMFFYMALFILYILAGVYITKSAPIGVCAGIVACWIMVELKSFIQRTRAERAKNKRREEIERAKKGL